ncbi:hypothetical protein FRC08_017099 [Ceratobasidium sp. 394]|nr:hypothetical protein FRC08_017099 [Ceratobasidium sp. 394]
MFAQCPRDISPVPIHLDVDELERIALDSGAQSTRACGTNVTSVRLQSTCTQSPGRTCTIGRDNEEIEAFNKIRRFHCWREYPSIRWSGRIWKLIHERDGHSGD